MKYTSSLTLGVLSSNVWTCFVILETKMNQLDMLCIIAKAYSSVIPKVTDTIKQGTLFVKKHIFFAIKYSCLLFRNSCVFQLFMMIIRPSTQYCKVR